MPKDIANRDYWANNMNASIEQLDLPYNKPEVLEALQKVAERHTGGLAAKSYNRNRAHVCSFFMQGKCNRGKACPYRHDDITDEDIKEEVLYNKTKEYWYYLIANNRPETDRILEEANIKASMISRSPMKKIVDSDIEYQQIIEEYNSWIHISFPPLNQKAKKQKLIINKSGVSYYS